jgi:hypothetical protein
MMMRRILSKPLLQQAAITSRAMSISLPPLPYDTTALEPHIGKQTLEIHHGKHHATYVTNTNNLSKFCVVPSS